MIKKSITITLALVVLFSGVAAAQTFKIQGYTYVPLWSVCRDKQIEFLWDSFGRVATLKKNGIEAKLRIQSDKMLIGDNLTDIGPPVRFYEGMVMVPRSFSQKIVPRAFNITYAAKPRKTGYTPAASASNRIEKIVIDPGHGGKDPGAIGRYGLREKDVVLDISKRLEKILSRNGIKIIMTRSTDVFIPLWKRSETGNSKKADLFISIHANAFQNRWTKGFEAYYLSDKTDDTARATEAAENNAVKLEKNSLDRYSRYAKTIACDLELYEQKRVSSGLAQYICEAARKGGIRINERRRDRGVKKAGFHVLRKTYHPSVLVEVGYISNKNEENLLKQSYYKQKLAEAIAKGILSYKNEYERTNGFTR